MVKKIDRLDKIHECMHACMHVGRLNYLLKE